MVHHPPFPNPTIPLTRIRHRFYLFFSSGRCCNDPATLPPAGDEYKILACRAPRPSGPFVDEHNTPCTQSGGKLVLASHDDVYGPGGQGVLYDEILGAPVLYYHYMNRSTGYKVEDVWFGWNRLDFESGWPVVVGADNKGKGRGGGGISGAMRTRAPAIVAVLTTVVVVVGTLPAF